MPPDSGDVEHFATHWFQLKWLESWPNYHITVKELIPVVIAAAICGGGLIGNSLMFRFVLIIQL